jgi:cellulose synthase/poly-beta-1,6-N-acetylglucosamine synthase-like glycosyltransferase
MSFLAIMFWLCIAGVFYIYAGYPLIIGLLARLFPKPVIKAPNEYSTSVIIAIYNESPRLDAKLRNILAVRGAERITQILVGSDGSTDQPEAVIKAINDQRIQLTLFPERRGKPSVLNDLIPNAVGDILVMMDVRQRLDDAAITSLLENFSDPSVGVVSGELIFERNESDSSAAGGVDAYWRYEKWLRDREGRFGSVPGATGALYAIRRELVNPIPAETALDDVLIPMQAITREYRCIFDCSAKIYDRPAQDPVSEAIRKRRTLAGCVQLLMLHPKWCLPGGHPIWWQYSSHKIARLFSPILLAAALPCSILLVSGHPIYGMILAGQIIFYILGAIGIAGKNKDQHGTSNKSGLVSLMHLIGVFLIMQGALLMGWKDGLGRKNLALWRKA